MFFCLYFCLLCVLCASVVNRICEVIFELSLSLSFAHIRTTKSTKTWE